MLNFVVFHFIYISVYSENAKTSVHKHQMNKIKYISFFLFIASYIFM